MLNNYHLEHTDTSYCVFVFNRVVSFDLFTVFSELKLRQRADDSYNYMWWIKQVSLCMKIPQWPLEEASSHEIYMTLNTIWQLDKDN